MAVMLCIDDLQNTRPIDSFRQLTNGIAHEIKNPLNFVNNFAQLSVELATELETVLGRENVSAENASELQSILEDLKFNALKIKEYGQRADRVVCAMLERGQARRGAQQLENVDQLIDTFLERNRRAA